jgi:tRNA threonylcarbamoyladenosine biosynthesis protein TsaE
MITHRFLSSSPQETFSHAREFASKLKAGDTTALFGELGAGKTFFVGGVVSRFDRNIQVNSPTFTMMNLYPTQPPINHFDLYRVRSEIDLLDIGLPDYFDSEGIVLIEWAEKCERILPNHHYRVTMKITGESSREITIEEWG